MALPGMDLQSQYNQTLQNTIGQSQAERLRQTRQQQSIASTDWQQRGVGEGAKRMAGFQEVNPSAMPHMSSDTRSFIQPLLGNYQEGGKQVEGYYGKDNPYTQPGLENLLGQQGYARAPTSLSEQFKSVGLKLPNAYGQDYYNADYERLGSRLPTTSQQTLQADRQKQIDELYSRVTASTAEYQSRYAPAKASIEKYTGYGFRPGQNNGDWIWYNGVAGGFPGPIPEKKVWDMTNTVKDANGAYYNHPNPDYIGMTDAQISVKESADDLERGAGYWLNSNGSPRGLKYHPLMGFGEADFDSAPKGFAKFMPAITMTALGAMFGGAGALAGGGAGTVGGAVGQGVGGAIPSTLQTGVSTGDWGKALGTGGVSALAGGLSGAYGSDLAKALGLSGATGNNIAKGLISGSVNTLGKAALGGANYKGALANTLASVAAPYLGDLTKNAIGGTAGDIFGGAVGGFSGNALKNILQGKSVDIGTALATLQGAAGGLGKLFSNTNEDKQTVNGPTSLVKTLQGVKNGPTATSRRT